MSAQSLLPSGFYDLLPPLAAKRTRLVASLLSYFGEKGYDEVSPPLLEFEDTLLAGRGESMGKTVFRVMDPASHRMLALRSDMTLQVARIADTLLANAPRPLKLCYGGSNIRVAPEPLETSRQQTQVGLEIFGEQNADHLTMVIKTVLDALETIGIKGISIDLSMPHWLAALMQDIPEEERDVWLGIISKKDAAAAANHPLIAQLIQAAGPAKTALSALSTLDLLPPFQTTLAEIRAMIEALSQDSLTLDPLESRGFSYYNGLAFSLFLPGQSGEIGRGGRYLTPAGAPATGLTLYVDRLVERITVL